MKFSDDGLEKLQKQSFAKNYRGELETDATEFARKLDGKLKTKIEQDAFDDLVILAVKEGGPDKRAVQAKIKELTAPPESEKKEEEDGEKPPERKEVGLFKQGQLMVRQLRKPLPKDSKAIIQYVKDREIDLLKSKELRELLGEQHLVGPAKELTQALIPILEAAEKEGERLLKLGEDSLLDQQGLEDDIENLFATRLRGDVPPEAEKALRALLLKNGMEDRTALSVVALLQKRQWAEAGKLLKIRLEDPPPTDRELAELEKEMRGMLKVDPGEKAVDGLVAIAVERGPKNPLIKKITDLLNGLDWDAAGKLLKMDLGDPPPDKETEKAAAKAEEARKKLEQKQVEELEDLVSGFEKDIDRALSQNGDERIDRLTELLDESGKTMGKIAATRKALEEHRKGLDALKKTLTEVRQKAQTALKETMAGQEEMDEVDALLEREIKVKLPKPVRIAARDYVLEHKPKSKASLEMVRLLNAGELELAGKKLKMKLKDRHSPLELKTEKALKPEKLQKLVTEAHKIIAALEKLEAPTTPEGWETLYLALQEALKEAESVQKEVDHALKELGVLAEAQHKRTKKLANLRSKLKNRDEDQDDLEDAGLRLYQAIEAAELLEKQAKEEVSTNKAASKRIEDKLKKSSLSKSEQKSVLEAVIRLGPTSAQVKKAMEQIAAGARATAARMLGIPL